jgi:hypothetical protein
VEVWQGLVASHPLIYQLQNAIAQMETWEERCLSGASAHHYASKQGASEHAWQKLIWSIKSFVVLAHRQKRRGESVPVQGSDKGFKRAALLCGLLLLLQMVQITHASPNWQVAFGGCTFRGNTNGLLERNGTCPTQAGTLDLSNKGITLVAEDSFNGMSALRSLNLGDNMLTTLPSDVFSGLGALSYLNLSFNMQTTLPAGVFSDLTRLMELDLSYNNLTVFPSDVFSSLKREMLMDMLAGGMRRQERDPAPRTYYDPFEKRIVTVSGSAQSAVLLLQ